MVNCNNNNSCTTTTRVITLKKVQVKSRGEVLVCGLGMMSPAKAERLLLALSTLQVLYLQKIGKLYFSNDA